MPTPSGSEGSNSVASVFDGLLLEKVSPLASGLFKNALLFIINAFKDPTQWSSLDSALAVLDHSARLAHVNVQSLHNYLSEFYNSTKKLEAVRNVVVAPKILNYQKELTSLKEQLSHSVDILAIHEVTSQSLHEKIRISDRNKVVIDDQIVLLEKEILLLKGKKEEEDVIIHQAREELEANIRTIDLVKAEQVKNQEVATLLESKLADIPDQAKIIMEAEQATSASQLQLKEELQHYMTALDINEDL